jgi:hypothetical protein
VSQSCWICSADFGVPTVDIGLLSFDALKLATALPVCPAC